MKYQRKFIFTIRLVLRIQIWINIQKYRGFKGTINNKGYIGMQTQFMFYETYEIRTEIYIYPLQINNATNVADYYTKNAALKAPFINEYV